MRTAEFKRTPAAVLRPKLKFRPWRIKFFASYLLAAARYRRIALILLSLTEDSFACPWVSKVTLEFLPFPPPPCDEYPIPISAPVAVTVWHGNRKALLMSGYFLGQRWHIQQLQGARAINVPADLEWPIRFVSACQALAVAGKLKEVRLSTARELVPYCKPPVRVRDGQTVEQAMTEIYERMLAHYDETAQRLGFVRRGRWAVWQPAAMPLEKAIAPTVQEQRKAAI